LAESLLILFFAASTADLLSTMFSITSSLMFLISFIEMAIADGLLNDYESCPIRLCLFNVIFRFILLSIALIFRLSRASLLMNAFLEAKI
jgi:hypothetical protein